MSGQNREGIFAAFFAKLAGLPGVVTASRSWRPPSEVPANEQPAVFLLQGSQHATAERGKPTKWTFAGDIVVYAHALERGGILASTQLNTLVDAIESAVFAQGADGLRSLGGLVHDIRIEGECTINAGEVDGQARAILPFVIVPNC